MIIDAPTPRIDEGTWMTAAPTLQMRRVEQLQPEGPIVEATMPGPPQRRTVLDLLISLPRVVAAIAVVSVYVVVPLILAMLSAVSTATAAIAIALTLVA